MSSGRANKMLLGLSIFMMLLVIVTAMIVVHFGERLYR